MMSKNKILATMIALGASTSLCKINCPKDQNIGESSTVIALSTNSDQVGAHLPYLVNPQHQL